MGFVESGPGPGAAPQVAAGARRAAVAHPAALEVVPASDRHQVPEQNKPIALKTQWRRVPSLRRETETVSSWSYPLIRAGQKEDRLLPRIMTRVGGNVASLPIFKFVLNTGACGTNVEQERISLLAKEGWPRHQKE